MRVAETVVARLAGFRDLPPEASARFARSLEVSKHPTGHVLLVKGTAGDGLYVLLDGHVEVRDDAGRALNRLGPGSLVGLVALAGQPARTATLVATSALEVAWLGRRAYEALPEQDPDLAVALELAIAAQMASDMRGLASQVRDALTRRSA